MQFADTAEFIEPDELAAAAQRYRSRGNVGVAFTYNEPLVGYEYVRDTAKLVHEAGMVNVLVSNGTAELAVLDEILPYIDAMNIDLKGFTDRYYQDVLGGDRAMVMRFIERAVQFCHVELTTLIIPCENDTEEEMREMCTWIASLRGIAQGSEIPLHISRFFPRFHMTDRAATDVAKVYKLADVAREKLSYVYTGNC
jgi:pyruvate formate lyase activating enzyme